MSSKRHRNGVGDSIGDLLSIIDGRPWDARQFKNNNLRQHARMLGRTFRRPNAWTSRLAEPCARLLRVLSDRGRVLCDGHPSDVPCVPVLLRTLGYREHWIREPECWSPAEGSSPRAELVSLVSHLLARYPVPAFFEEVWFTPGKLEHVHRDWYCHVVQGGNIRQAPSMVARLSKRAAHLLMNDAPEDLKLTGAVRWAQASALGADDSSARRFAGSKMGADFSNDRVWLPLMEMAIAAPALDWSNLDIVIDHLAHRLDTVSVSPKVSVKGRSLGCLYREARNAFAALAKAAKGYGLDIDAAEIADPSTREFLLRLVKRRWPPMHGVGAFRRKIGRFDWEMVEICSQHELVVEGRAMRHCIGSYGQACMNGRSAVFSLRTLDEGDALRQVTVEVELWPRRIKEARRKWNIRTDSEDCGVIRTWAEANGIDAGALSA